MIDDDEIDEIDTIEQATAALHRLFAAQDSVSRAEAHATAYLDRVRREAAAAIALETESLAVYYSRHPPKRGKTLHLPSGGFQAVDVPSRLAVVDQALLLAWAEAEAPTIVSRPPPKVQPCRVLHEDLVGHVDKTGEVPPGVEVTTGWIDYRAKRPKKVTT